MTAKHGKELIYNLEKYKIIVHVFCEQLKNSYIISESKTEKITNLIKSKHWEQDLEQPIFIENIAEWLYFEISEIVFEAKNDNLLGYRRVSVLKVQISEKTKDPSIETWYSYE